MTDKNIAALRHLYANLVGEGVSNAEQAKNIAEGLLSPVIERMEQALSAAPASPWSRALEIRMAQGWKLRGDRIPVLYTDTINGEVVGRDDLWLCTTEAFAASPTPPAEQRAQPGAVYAELPHSVGEHKYGGGLFTEAQMRDFADRTHALRMKQAAPKAAPREPINGWPVEATIYKRRDEWVLELSGTINDCAFTCRHTQPGYLQPEDVAGLPSLYSEGIAPQQEAQEPVALLVRKNSWRAGQWEVAPPGSPSYGLGWADQRKYVYAAPQPTPAPLSRDQIREVFMAHGFTIKEGQTDLKQYVYDAAYALLGTKPAPLSEQAEEAAMYRWLRAQHEDDSGEPRCCVYAPNDMRECLVPVGDMPGELDAFIRAALAAQGGK